VLAPSVGAHLGAFRYGELGLAFGRKGAPLVHIHLQGW